MYLCRLIEERFLFRGITSRQVKECVPPCYYLYTAFCIPAAFRTSVPFFCEQSYITYMKHPKYWLFYNIC